MLIIIITILIIIIILMSGIPVQLNPRFRERRLACRILDE
jgi:hypothetical protein